MALSHLFVALLLPYTFHTDSVYTHKCLLEEKTNGYTQVLTSILVLCLHFKVKSTSCPLFYINVDVRNINGRPGDQLYWYHSFQHCFLLYSKSWQHAVISSLLYLTHHFFRMYNNYLLKTYLCVKAFWHFFVCC